MNEERERERRSTASDHVLIVSHTLPPCAIASLKLCSYRRAMNHRAGILHQTSSALFLCDMQVCVLKICMPQSFDIWFGACITHAGGIQSKDTVFRKYSWCQQEAAERFANIACAHHRHRTLASRLVITNLQDDAILCVLC